MKLPTVAALCLIGSAQLSCATVILVTLSHDQTGDAIYVGADGRLTYTDAAGNDLAFFDTCKIRKIGNFIVADSGVITDTSTRFDFWSFIATIKAKSVADLAAQIAAQLPLKYEAIHTKLIPGDVGVMAFEEGKPAFFRIIFMRENDVVKAILKNDGDLFAPQKNPISSQTAVIGEFGTISISDFANLNCATNDPVSDMRCTLAAYIKADPEHINEPIAILKITRSGSQWIERGACEDQK